MPQSMQIRVPRYTPGQSSATPPKGGANAGTAQHPGNREIYRCHETRGFIYGKYFSIFQHFRFILSLDQI